MPALQSQFNEQAQITEKLQKTWADWQVELNQVQSKQQQLTEQRHSFQQQDEKLRQEVMRSLMGESAFDAALIKEMLEMNKADLEATEAKIEALEEEKDAEESRLKYLSTQYQLINDWAAEFDAADNDTKKMILARLIEKITVDKDYHLTIVFYVAEDSFRERISEEKPLIQVDEAEHCIPAVAM